MWYTTYMGTLVDITGNQYGRWTVISRAENAKNNQTSWTCRCSCGNERVVAKSNLLNGKSTGCQSCRTSESYLGGSTQILLDETSAAKRVYKDYKNKCVKKGIYFDLTYEQFKWFAEKPCMYCGQVDSNFAKRSHQRALDWKYNGLDRVDTNLGYYTENIVTCCKYCNRAKSDQTLQDYIDRCHAVVERFKHTWTFSSGSGAVYMRKGWEEEFNA